MKNWSTDETAFSSKQKKRAWELIQGINFGFDDSPVTSAEVKQFWPQIVHHLTPQSRRLWELWLWDRTYSLPLTGSYWPKSAATGI